MTAAQPEEGKGEPYYLTFIWILENTRTPGPQESWTLWTPHLIPKNGLITGLFPEK